MICKRILNYGEENRIKEFDKYEFDLFITTDKEDLIDFDEKTIIFVENEDDVKKAFNSIAYAAKYAGLITTSIADLYNIFYKSGIWNFKRIISKSKVEVIKEILNIKSNTLFLSFFVNDNISTFDYFDVVEQCRNNDEQYIYFAFPLINENIDYIEVIVLYK